MLCDLSIHEEMKYKSEINRGIIRGNKVIGLRDAIRISTQKKNYLVEL